MINDTKRRVLNGIFSRLFRLRRPSAESEKTTKTTRAGKNNHLDENHADETDDGSFSSTSSLSFSSTSSSSSLSSHIIDRILVGPLDTGHTSSIAPDTGCPGAAAYDNIPGSSIQSCLKLLSSEDIDQNRVGLQRLAMLTKGRRLSGLYRSEEIAAHVLVFGGAPGSIEEQLRYNFATMICDNPHEYPTTVPILLTDPNDEKEALFDWILDYDPITGLDGNGNHVSYCDDDDDGNDDDSSCSYDSYCSEHTEYEPLHPQGKAGGALHNHALRVLANALARVESSTTTTTTTERGERLIPLQGSIWKNIICNLVDNIETNRDADATGYSLKILRRLHSVHPETIEPLLKYSLLDQLVFLTEYGKRSWFPVIYLEASELLRQTRYNPASW